MECTQGSKENNAALRQTGIGPVGAVPWGSHFCQFYETPDDLVETLVPYFKEGLSANEFCMWITSAPLRVEEAAAALKKAFPDLDRCLAKGQIEILDYREWYTKSGVFNADEVLKGWVDKLDAALKRGYEGLRLTGNTFWLERADWNDFTKYEEAVNNIIGRYKMLAICTYSLKKCGALEVADVVANHEFALLKRAGKWQIIENSRQKRAVDTARSFSDAVVRTTGGLIVGLDKDGGIQLFNRACERTTGYTFEEIKDRPFWDFLLVPEEKEGVKKVFAGIMDGSIGADMEFENYWVSKDGSPRWIRWANSALRDDTGNVSLVIGTGIDITEQAMARRKIEELNSFLIKRAAELAVINKDLEAISHTVTHGLHKPVGVLRGHSRRLLEDYGDKLDQKGKDLVRSLNDDIRRMERIIERILDLSHIAHKDLWLQPVDMSTHAAEILQELQEKESARQVEIVIQKKLNVKADKALIHQALENLLENAWKFTRERTDARIEFGMQSDSGDPVFYVRDNGVGFDIKDVGEFFSAFLRTNPGDEFLDAGTGLTIVERIIRRHNGTVWAESEKKKGTSIYFKLPSR